MASITTLRLGESETLVLKVWQVSRRLPVSWAWSSSSLALYRIHLFLSLRLCSFVRPSAVSFAAFALWSCSSASSSAVPHLVTPLVFTAESTNRELLPRCCPGSWPLLLCCLVTSSVTSSTHRPEIGGAGEVVALSCSLGTARSVWTSHRNPAC